MRWPALRTRERASLLAVEAVSDVTVRRAVWAIWESGAQFVQLALSVHMVGFALVLFDGHGTFSTSRSYRWMAQLGSEPHWGALCLTIGIFGLSAVFNRSAHYRIAAALISSLTAGGLAWGFFVSSANSTGWWTYAVLTGLSYWLLWHRIYRHA